MTSRKPTHKINPLILNRWSPRSFSASYELSDETLFSLFEAARWAPSSYNNQPWRFIYAKRNAEHWNRLLGLLGDFNQQWCINASVLIVVISKKTFDFNSKPSITHQFDTGAAWENLAIQAESEGLSAHGMQGFDYERAKKELDIPDEFDVMAMIAVGKIASKEELPPSLQEREFPSDRRPLSEMVMQGKYGNGIK